MPLPDRVYAFVSIKHGSTVLNTTCLQLFVMIRAKWWTSVAGVGKTLLRHSLARSTTRPSVEQEQPVRIRSSEISPDAAPGAHACGSAALGTVDVQCVAALAQLSALRVAVCEVDWAFVVKSCGWITPIGIPTGAWHWRKLPTGCRRRRWWRWRWSVPVGAVRSFQHGCWPLCGARPQSLRHDWCSRTRAWEMRVVLAVVRVPGSISLAAAEEHQVFRVLIIGPGANRST